MLNESITDDTNRRHQLRVAEDLIVRYGRPGRLVDVGCGDGRLIRAWNGPAIGVDPSPSATEGVLRGDAAALPVRTGAAQTATAIASLGAFDAATIRLPLAEMARVLEPGGVAVILVSARNVLADLLSPWRIHTRWRWCSFEPDVLVSEATEAGLHVVARKRLGGLRSLIGEWVAVVVPRLPRWAWVRGLQFSDASEFVAERRRGRYLYLVCVRR